MSNNSTDITVTPSIKEEDGKKVSLSGWSLILMTVLGTGLSLFHLYTGFFGALPNLLQRAPHVGVSLALAFALFDVHGGWRRTHRIPFYDLVLMVITLVTSAFIVMSYNRIMDLDYRPSNLDLWMGGILTVIVLEAARRVVGKLFSFLAVLTLLYAYFGAYFPGVWVHRGIPLDLMIEVLYTSTRGLWGLITGISATIIAMFVIFGAVLLRTRGGQTFMDLSIWLSGRSVGGAAKVATIASSLFGTVSGSAAANVATTGTFTIPLMKRLGYRAEFAAGVESVASTGGQLMPPIMGAGAFIMAELLGIHYLTIMVAGLIPALLYYCGAFAAIHFEASRVGYGRLPEEQIPKASSFIGWRQSLPLFIPLTILMYLLVNGYTPVTCAFWAVLATMVLHLATAPSLSALKGRCLDLFHALRSAGQGMVMVATLIVAAQIILAMISLTGVGVKFSGLILALGEKSLILSLVMAMVVSLILGMGLPTAAAYLLAAAVVAPALSRLGLEPIVAHFFVFYFAIVAGLTPPVCGTVFIASSMAQANWVHTAWVSLRLALPAFIVPFMFALNPSLLLIGDPWRVALAVATASIGVIALAASAMGYMLTDLALWVRLILLGNAILLIFPGWQTDVIGAIVLAAIIFCQRRNVKAAPTITAVRGG